jgi:hypothetical protein
MQAVLFVSVLALAFAIALGLGFGALEALLRTLMPVKSKRRVYAPSPRKSPSCRSISGKASSRTVEFRKSRIMGKLNLHTAADPTKFETADGIAGRDVTLIPGNPSTQDQHRTSQLTRFFAWGAHPKSPARKHKMRHGKGFSSRRN